MEIDIYHKGKKFVADNMKALNTILEELNRPALSAEELTNVRFEIIVKMLEADERLRKRVKGFVLVYC